jgi:hypothetical protein
MKTVKSLPLIVFFTLSVGVAVDNALAGPIVVTTPESYLDTRSANRIGTYTGTRIEIGAISVMPDGAAGTTGIATQGAFSTTLPFNGNSVNQHQFFQAITYDPALTGAWTLTFSNLSATPTTTVVTTPAIGSALPEPYVNNATFSGSGLNPTINWTNPTGSNGTLIIIRDFSPPFAAGGGLNSIHLVRLPAGTTQYLIPTVLSTGLSLQTDHRYSLEVDASNTVGSNLVAISRVFFEFTPQSIVLALPSNIYLPIVANGPGGIPIYNFNMVVTGGQTYYIDPQVATGYTFEDGANDPAFASVVLPTGIGDNTFDLWLFNGSIFVDSGFDLTGGVPFDFLTHGFANGLTEFQIRGIETSAGVDLNNPLAFVTGLTFVGDGTFTGTMTPLEATVPEPSTIALIGVAFAGLGWRRRKEWLMDAPTRARSAGACRFCHQAV